MVKRRTNNQNQGRNRDLEVGDVRPSDSSAPTLPESLPAKVIFGYYAHIKKKDLLNYLDAKAKSSLAFEDSYYNVTPYKDGFLWELHEGGSGKGALSSVKAKLGAGDEPIVIRTSIGGIRVSKNTTKGTIDCYNLSEDDSSSASNGIHFKDSMSPIVSKGYGTFIAGLILFSLSVLSLFLSALFKFVIFNQSVDAEPHKSKYSMPMSAYDRIVNVGEDDDRIYIHNFYFDRGQWKIKKATASVKTAQEDLPQELIDKLNNKSGNQATKAPEPINKKAALENSISKKGGK